MYALVGRAWHELVHVPSNLGGELTLRRLVKERSVELRDAYNAQDMRELEREQREKAPRNGRLDQFKKSFK